MKNAWKYILVGVLAIILVVLTYKLPKYLPDTVSEQEFIANTLSRIRSKDTDERILAELKNDFLLVNTTYDRSLGQIGKNDPINYYYKGKAARTITNRKLLYNLFSWLEQHDQCFSVVVVDIMFYGASRAHDEQPYDDSLGIVFQKLADRKKILLAANYNSDNLIIDDNYTPFVDASCYGDVRVNARSEKQTVYILSAGNHVASIPLLMLERIDTVKYRLNALGLLQVDSPKKENNLSYNYIIPQLYVSGADLDRLNKFGFTDFNNEINYFNLGDLREDVHPLLKSTLTTEKKKAVFVGAFSGDHADMHGTSFGDMDGALYLLNVYYNLKHNNSKVNWWACLGLLVFYFWCLFRIIIVPHGSPDNTTLWKFLFNKVVVDNRHYIVLVVMVVLYYYIFDQVINILYIGVVFLILETIVKTTHDYLEVKVKRFDKQS